MKSGIFRVCKSDVYPVVFRADSNQNQSDQNEISETEFMGNFNHYICD